MVKLRLARAGAKKNPFYRVVAVDSRYKRDGRFLEKLGTYDPAAAENRLVLDADRVQHWLSKGAQPSDTVAQLLRQEKRASAEA
jgi:small subunit ribosomal protein S16